MEKIEKKINKLFQETELKLDAAKQNRRVIMIDFTRRYNEIMMEASAKN